MLQEIQTPAPSEILAQLERLCGSRWLKESAQLQSLLRYLVGETLASRTDGLKEYRLGMEVFHRGASYDPRTDAIVRVQASLLRKKLQGYYEHEGDTDSLVIELPRGGYVPVFRPRPAPPDAAAASPPPVVEVVPAVTVPARPVLRGWSFLAGFALALLLALAMSMVTREPEPRRTQAMKPADFPELWGGFVRPPGIETMVTFGVPLFYAGGSGLFFRDTQINEPGEDRRTGRLEALAKALNASLHPQPDVYTGIGETLAVHQLSSFLNENGVPSRVASSRSLGPSDWKDRNLIVAASLRFRTPLQDWNLPSDFRFDAEADGSIVNLKPLPGERDRYLHVPGEGVSTAYALISVWPGLSPGRRILALRGVHTWCTQGAADFLMNPRQVAALRAKMAQDATIGRRGKPSPFFQILLRVEGRSNVLHSVEYVTHHYLPLDDKPLTR